MEFKHNEADDNCHNKRGLDDATLLATEPTATVVPSVCDTISTTNPHKHPRSSSTHNEATNPSMNRKTRRRNETKSNKNDAYHTAYQNYRYQLVYFTYHNLPKIEASPSLLSKIEYHIHPPTSTTTIRPIPPPPPGTPLCYFKASYLVSSSIDCSSSSTVVDGDDAVNEIVADMMVHQHVNGLCVVCVANPTAIRQQLQQDDDKGTFQYHVSVTSSELSLAQKRKRNTKQLQGKKNNPNNHHGLVQPCDTLATLALPTSSDTTTTTVRFPCCVMGSIIELNARFRTPEEPVLLPFSLLESDPYGTGYLAIILPSGPFPPPAPTHTRM